MVFILFKMQLPQSQCPHSSLVSFFTLHQNLSSSAPSLVHALCFLPSGSVKGKKQASPSMVLFALHVLRTLFEEMHDEE